MGICCTRPTPEEEAAPLINDKEFPSPESPTCPPYEDGSASWAVRADIHRRNRLWANHHINDLFPNMLRKRGCAGGYVDGIVHSLQATLETAPTQEEFIAAFIEVVDENTLDAIQELDKCHLRAALYETMNGQQLIKMAKRYQATVTARSHP